MIEAFTEMKPYPCECLVQSAPGAGYYCSRDATRWVALVHKTRGTVNMKACTQHSRALLRQYPLSTVRPMGLR